MSDGAMRQVNRWCDALNQPRDGSVATHLADSSSAVDCNAATG